MGGLYWFRDVLVKNSMMYHWPMDYLCTFCGLVIDVKEYAASARVAFDAAIIKRRLMANGTYIANVDFCSW